MRSCTISQLTWPTEYTRFTQPLQSVRSVQIFTWYLHWFTMHCYAFTAVPKRRCRSRLRFTCHSITLSFWLKHENRFSSHVTQCIIQCITKCLINCTILSHIIAFPWQPWFNTGFQNHLTCSVLTPACFGTCVALWSANLELEIL